MKCCCWRLLISVLYSARIPTGLRALAWRLSCGCTKALSHPEAPMCQYQEGQCVRAGRSIVVCVCLAWLSPLNQQRPTTEMGDNVISRICLLSFCLSGCLSGCVCWHWHRIPISSRAPPSFCCSLPSSLLSAHTSKLTFPCLPLGTLSHGIALSHTKQWETVVKCAAKRKQSGSISPLPTLAL